MNKDRYRRILEKQNGIALPALHTLSMIARPALYGLTIFFGQKGVRNAHLAHQQPIFRLGKLALSSFDVRKKAKAMLFRI